jgi:two-component system response regulator GlrR
VPPLSKRREDIPLLVAHFLTQILEKSKKKVTGFSPEAMELFISAPWPGNVRQLWNVVEQTVALSTTPIISASLVQNAFRDKSLSMPSLEEAKTRFEREYLIQILQMTEGNVAQAASLAKRNRTEFYKLLNRHKLIPSQFRPSSSS